MQTWLHFWPHSCTPYPKATIGYWRFKIQARASFKSTNPPWIPCFPLLYFLFLSLFLSLSLWILFVSFFLHISHTLSFFSVFLCAASPHHDWLIWIFKQWPIPLFPPFRLNTHTHTQSLRHRMYAGPFFPPSLFQNNQMVRQELRDRQQQPAESPLRVTSQSHSHTLSLRA